MTAVDQERVDRARERLESATREGRVSDPAIRIVKLNPPEEGATPVALNRKMTVLSAMSSSGVRTLFTTIDGMQRDAGAEFVDSDIDELSIDPSDPEVQKLLVLIDSCDKALLLSGAETRGADLVLSELDEKIAALQSVQTQTAQVASPVTGGASGVPSGWPVDRTVSTEFADFIAKVLESPAIAQPIEDGLELLSSDPRRIALKAACALDVAAGSKGNSGLFGSNGSNQSHILRAEAEGELSEYDMAPGSPAYVLAARLESVGITASPLDVSDVATNLLAQIDQAKLDRAAYEDSTKALTGDAAHIVAEREQVASRRAAAWRRQSTQRHLRRIAQSQLDEHGQRARGLMPVLIEEPFADLPDELTTTTLSMLRTHSEIAQVILVTSRSDIGRWCDGQSDSVAAVRATGWFAEEHDGW